LARMMSVARIVPKYNVVGADDEESEPTRSGRS
jgi:hypothetical protein